MVTLNPLGGTPLGGQTNSSGGQPQNSPNKVLSIPWN